VVFERLVQMQSLGEARDQTKDSHQEFDVHYC
jgi:hypothetical protein